MERGADANSHRATTPHLSYYSLSARTIDLPQETPLKDMPTPQTQWLFYAISSGACAALNGVFAKLTTTQLTTSWATGLSHFFGLKNESIVFELLVRGVRTCSILCHLSAPLTLNAQFFFAMNLLFNAIMWGLFTRALTLASSTVRVSVINTSANFMLTALLGLIIFRETLPGKSSYISPLTTEPQVLMLYNLGLWWLGASFLVAGSVIIGRREEGKESGDAGTAGAEPTVAAGGQVYSDEPDAPLGSRAGQAVGGDLELSSSDRPRSRSADRSGRLVDE